MLNGACRRAKSDMAVQRKLGRSHRIERDHHICLCARIDCIVTLHAFAAFLGHIKFVGRHQIQVIVIVVTVRVVIVDVEECRLLVDGL